MSAPVGWGGGPKVNTFEQDSSDGHQTSPTLREGSCRVRSNGPWIMVTWDPPVDRQTRLISITFLVSKQGDKLEHSNADGSIVTYRLYLKIFFNIYNV